MDKVYEINTWISGYFRQDGGFAGIGKWPIFGAIGHHLIVAIIDHIPNGWVMFNGDMTNDPWFDGLSVPFSCNTATPRSDRAKSQWASPLSHFLYYPLVIISDIHLICMYIYILYIHIYTYNIYIYIQYIYIYNIYIYIYIQYIYIYNMCIYIYTHKI